MNKYSQKMILFLALSIFVIVFSNISSRADDYTYDGNGRVSKVVHDDGSVTTYEYDINGNIISVDTTYSKTDENVGGNTSQSSTSGNKMDEYTNIDKSVPENNNLGSNNSNNDLQTNKNNLEKDEKNNNADNTSNEVTNNNNSKSNNNSIFTGDNAYIIPVAVVLIISLTGIIIVIKKRNEEH